MSKRFDLVVIGGGTAGIVASRFAAEAGARVALVEAERIGGDCLYTGCVPSKALLAAAERAHAVRTAGELGIEASAPEVDFGAVMGHVRRAIELAGEEDTPEFLRGMGIEVIEDRARFAGPGMVEAGGRALPFRAALIATGSSAAVPPIPGLADCDPLTNETLFELAEQPRRLLVLGGGAIGCEMSQAFGRLGSEVTLVEMEDRLLPSEEPEAGELIAEVLSGEGVAVRTGAGIESFDPGDRGSPLAHLSDGEGVGFDRVLVAAGRRAVTDGLGLDSVGVETDPRTGAIRTDERARTTGDRIFAAGDVAGSLQFTHFAAYQALIAMANGLFRVRQKVETDWVPWTIFTAPEIARAGMTEGDASERYGDAVRIYRHDYADNDRAITAGANRGFAKLVAGPRGKLVGATVAGPAAGESIVESARLIREGGRVTDLSQMIHVYPTFAEGPARAADEVWTDRYLTDTTRRLLRPLHAVLRRIDRPRD